MVGISTAIDCHETYRVVPCALCGSRWEERLVGVALNRLDSPIGPLCPRCLNHSPRQNATWLRAYAVKIQQAMENLKDSWDADDTPLAEERRRGEIMRVMRSIEKLRDLTALVRRSRNELRARLAATPLKLQVVQEQALQLQERAAKSQSAFEQHFASMVTNEVARAARAFSLASELFELERWPTSLEEVMAAEAVRLAQRFELRFNVSELVASRYKSYLLRTSARPRCTMSSSGVQ